MNLLNSILLFIAIFGFIFNYYLQKRKLKLIKYNISFNELPEIINRLSLDMANQVLKINKSESLFLLLRKYQIKEKWGITLTFICDNKHKDSINKLCKNFNINSIIYLKEENSKIEIEFDIGNELNILINIINDVWLNIFNFTIDSSLKCVFTKKSKQF